MSPTEWDDDSVPEPNKGWANDPPQSDCRGCREKVWTMPFCGYCGFRNAAFDDQTFTQTCNCSIHEFREYHCTDWGHKETVLRWKAVATETRDTDTTARMRFCPACGKELVFDQAMKDLQISFLLDDLKSER